MTAGPSALLDGAPADQARRATARSISRVTLGDATDDKLFFAQVREDPRIELDALRPARTDRVVVVSSGGCTALSLLGAGAGEVHAVDSNRTQNHVVELKAIAVRELAHSDALAFVGGVPASEAARRTTYAYLRPHLSAAAASYWDDRMHAVARGIINAGVSERFIALIATVVRRVVHGPGLVERLLACRSLEEQRALFESEWNSWAWRALFSVLLNRWSMSRAYDRRFFEEVGRSDFASHFRDLANHALTEIPVAGNYFLHQMLVGHYPVEEPDGVPPYLSADGAAAIARRSESLLLVDGGITQHLRTLPDRSVDAFALSNVCEWMNDAGVADLFTEIDRVAADGARVVFRNFVGWTELPRASKRLREDVARGRELIARDRSMVQSRVVVCHAGPG